MITNTQPEAAVRSTQLQQPAVLIATSSTELFSAWIAEHAIERTTLVDAGEKALQWVTTTPPDLVFLDFRALRDGWTGMRLTRQLRRSLGPRPWIRLMAESQDPQLQELVVQAGGDGLIRRSARAVFKAVEGSQAQRRPGQGAAQSAAVADYNRRRIFETFQRHAGPLASLHIAEVLEGADDDLPLAERLASRLVLPRARELFLASIRQ